MKATMSISRLARTREDPHASPPCPQPWSEISPKTLEDECVTTVASNPFHICFRKVHRVLDGGRKSVQTRIPSVSAPTSSQYGKCGHPPFSHFYQQTGGSSDETVPDAITLQIIFDYT